MTELDAENEHAQKKELTAEEQDRLERAQVICDHMVTEMQMNMITDAKHGIEVSSIVRDTTGYDFSDSWDVQVALELTENYFNGLPTKFHYESSRSSENGGEAQNHYSLTVGHLPGVVLESEEVSDGKR